MSEMNETASALDSARDALIAAMKTEGCTGIRGDGYHFVVGQRLEWPEVTRLTGGERDRRVWAEALEDVIARLVDAAGSESPSIWLDDPTTKALVDWLRARVVEIRGGR